MGTASFIIYLLILLEYILEWSIHLHFVLYTFEAEPARLVHDCFYFIFEEISFMLQFLISNIKVTVSFA